MQTNEKEITSNLRGAQKETPKATVVRTKEALPPEYRSVGRNDLCPCGSGKKFKKCHGAGL